MQGWIKLHRSIMENEMYLSERFTRTQAWIDLLLLANHKPATIFIRGNEIRLKRGQLAWSVVSLAERWRWNERTVSGFLLWLQNRQMIQSRKSNITTVISIVNYDCYQSATEQSTEQMQSRVQTDKNDKNEENVFVASLIRYLNDNGVSFDEENLRARIRRGLTDYRQADIRQAVNDAVGSWKNNGHAGNFVSYLFTTLEHNYTRYQS